MTVVVSYDPDGKMVISAPMNSGSAGDTMTWDEATEPDRLAIEFISTMGAEIEMLRTEKIGLAAALVALVHLVREGRTDDFDQMVHQLTGIDNDEDDSTNLFTPELRELLIELDSLTEETEPEPDHEVEMYVTAPGSSFAFSSAEMKAVQDGESITIEWDAGGELHMFTDEGDER